MKLLFCPVCKDVQGLIGRAWRRCLCGRSGGQYNADFMTATIGGDAQVLGIPNPFLHPLWQELTQAQRRKYRQKNYGQSDTDCWYGDFKGDKQIVRIESPKGPRVKVRIVPISGKENRVTVVDRRKFLIGQLKIRTVAVPSNPTPELRSLLKDVARARGAPN